ncbi:hypothetical protein OG292_22455 [Streptomyces sp. NBC_01511]|uniref:hypothetical protein n=1 Tax=Streptomyces sp. NBC_01511 TaxID=2903889 RepID=UPI003863C394
MPERAANWQWRERGSGAPYQQHVSVSQSSTTEPDPGLLAVIEHETNCIACQVREDGAYCPVAADLVRVAREARR